METALYLPIKKYLEAQGYEVKSEIDSCDIVACRGDESPVLVELKTSFNLQVLLQAIDRQAISDHVYVAIAEPKRPIADGVKTLCKKLGVGLITVHQEWVEVLLDPVPYTPRKNAKRLGALLKEFHHRVGDPNIGGSSKRPLMTAYRQDALRCAHFIHQQGTSQLRDIAQLAKVARAPGILQRDVYGWFVRTDRGRYALTARGQQALVQYADFISQLERL